MAPSSDPAGFLIEAHQVSVTFGTHTALAGVDATVREGEALTIIGPNGAGKTTLLKVMLGLIAPDGGTVRRRPGLSIGYMPQRIEVDATLPLTVRRFLAFAVPRNGRPSEERLRSVLGEVGAEHLLKNPLQEVSGGEMQRVLLARALLRDPDLLVLDEPARGVDVGGQADLYQLIGRIRDEHGCGVLMVSHDLHLVMAATDRVICLNQRVQCAGHPEAVSRHPGYTALFGDYPTARAFAIYHHHPGHAQGPDGALVPLTPTGGDAEPPAACGCGSTEPHDHG
ncbi:metal ABC transporter ATP-binding protein [Shumkonia mesophila]|uniref:metal ABC transporter ATP-binding protein n=1 Tax=Shumkonia mesophila TaxID=2838854 RepID=UPI0029341290|nr:metal ABC transporter ATP-binding protein [Shumkonia mesophila]